MKTLRQIASALALAFSMLTTLPLFRVHRFFPGINGYAVMFYPVVGAALGALLAAAWTLLHTLLPHETAAVSVFALSVLLTGALHLDGFADTADALFVPEERADAVMKDPHVGGMGMIATVTFLLLKAAAFIALPSATALIGVLAFSRFGATVLIYWLPYRRKSGMGTLAKAETRFVHVAVAALAVIGIAAALSLLPLLGATALFFALAPRWAMRRFGGFSGDLYGCCIEVSELFMLLLLAGRCCA